MVGPCGIIMRVWLKPVSGTCSICATLSLLRLCIVSIVSLIQICFMLTLLADFTLPFQCILFISFQHSQSMDTRFKEDERITNSGSCHQVNRETRL